VNVVGKIEFTAKIRELTGFVLVDFVITYDDVKLRGMAFSCRVIGPDGDIIDEVPPEQKMKGSRLSLAMEGRPGVSKV
jgi:hypothetical protein